MERSWLINSRGIAKKVKNATCSSDRLIEDCGANRECPKCQYRIDNSDVFPDWPGLPVGVKFEPSDEELVEHLAAKCGAQDTKPHMFIDEFIPTLDGEGIYSDHPENLPGAKKDGSSIHFFHKIVNAYATGQRKRRRVQTQHGSEAKHVRWHKTGKTKLVMDNGVKKGWKKIMVLYKNTKKGSKPDKTNWIMHQYHLGDSEDEKEGEFVVSKIFSQKPKHLEPSDTDEDSDVKALQTSPMTPSSNPPVPPRQAKSLFHDDTADNKLRSSSTKLKEEGLTGEANRASEDNVQLLDDMGCAAWFAGESQAVDDTDLSTIYDSLLCKESFDLGHESNTNTIFNRGETKFIGEGIEPSSVADLDNIELDSPPDFDLSILQFSSQDSLLGWFDRQ